MPVSTVTSKGQVTIPKQVRESLRIGTGDRVAFVVRDDGVVELRPETLDLRDLYGTLAPAKRKLTVSEMNEEIARAGAGSKVRRVRR